MTIKVIKDLFEQGKFQEVLDRSSHMETQEEASLTGNEQVEHKVYLSHALLALGHIEQAFQVATSARANIQKTNNIQLLLALLSAKIRVLLKLRQNYDAEALIIEGDTLLKKQVIVQQPDSIWIYLYRLVKGNFLHTKGKEEREIAIDLYHQALAGFEKLNTPYYIAATINWIGWFYYGEGHDNTALEYCQRAFTIFKRLKNKVSMADVSQNLGHIYLHKGDYDTMLEYYQQSLIYAEESGISFQIANSLGSVGWTYVLRWKLDIALEYFQRALALAETTGSKMLIASCELLTGIVYHMKGELDSSLNSLQRSLTLHKVCKNDYQVAVALFYLIRLTLDRKELSKAQSYLSNFQKIYTRYPSSKHIQLRYHLSEALVLKQSPRMVDKAQAQTILKQIVTERTLKWRWDEAMFGLLHLCELLVFEAKATGETEVWEEAKTFIDQFYTQAQHNKKFMYIGESLMLKAKIAMIEGELQQALNYLDQAKVVATENDIISLINKVGIERKRLEDDLEKWNELIHNNASLQERFQQAQIEEYLQKARQIIAAHLN